MITGSQALLIDNQERALVVADLHIGFERELAEMKINIPSQTPKLQAKLIEILKKTRPDVLIFLGDVKHAVPKIHIQEWEDIPVFFEEIQKFVGNIQIIPGNHDGSLELLVPRTVEMLSPKGIMVGEEEKISLLHGHAWPRAELFAADYLVIGHNHPVVHFVDWLGFRLVKQVWLSSKIEGE